VTRILVADDHDVVRRGLRVLLESEGDDWQICGEAESGREAVALAIRLRPDIAVLDLSMPDLNGLEATRQIRRHLPTVEVLIYTMHETDQLVRDVLFSGARGYLLKSESAAQLTSAIAALERHKPYFSPTVSETLLASFLSGSLTAGDEELARGRLTPREREIIQLLADGYKSRVIAEKLCISPKTVETHRAHIMQKLGVSSIVELVRYAIRNELIMP
jgi:DNA-binding NarL/FixJ family response regulator